MKGYIMNTHQYVLNESFKALLDSIFSDKEAATKLKKAFEEVVNDRATTQKINLDRLKAEALEEIGNELATKDFVDKRIAEVQKEIAEVRADYRSLRQEMKFYAIGLGVLIIILQPKVFDFITAFLK